MPVDIPKGRIDRVVVSLDGMGDGFAEPDGMKGCARIQCQEPMSTCSQEDELIKTQECLQKRPAYTCALCGIALAIR